MVEPGSEAVVGGSPAEARKLGKLLADSGSFFWKHLLDFLLILAVVYVPLGILQAMFPPPPAPASPDIPANPFSTPGQVGFALLFAVAGAFSFIALLLWIRQLLQKPEEKRSPLTVYREVLGVLWPFVTTFLIFFGTLIALYLLWALGLLLATLASAVLQASTNAFVKIIRIPTYILLFGSLFVAFLVSALFTIPLWPFTANAIVFQGERNWKALKHAVSLVRFKTLKIIGNILVMTILSFLLMLGIILVFMIPIAFTPQWFDRLIAGFLPMLIALGSVWQNLFMVFLYLDLKTVKDAGLS